MVFVSLVALIPLLRLTWAALLPGGEFDLQRIYNLIMGRRVFEAIINTLIIAFSSTALALLIGVTSALLVALTDMRAKSFWIFGLVIPLMIPPQVAAYAWLMAFSTLLRLANPLPCGGAAVCVMTPAPDALQACGRGPC